MRTQDQGCCALAKRGWIRYVQVADAMCTKCLRKKKLYRDIFIMLDRKVFRDVYIRFRLRIRDTLSHKSRYHAYVPYSLKCPTCKSHTERDIHFLLVCPGHNEVCEKYPCIDNEMPVEENFSCLMRGENSGDIRNVSTFLYRAFKHRNHCLTQSQNVVRLLVG